MGIGLVSQKVFTFTCSIFYAPNFSTIPCCGETCVLQTVVVSAVCSSLVRNTVSAGSAGVSMVDAFGGSLQTAAGTALRIVSC